MVTQQQIKQRLTYNPDNGLFTWLNGRIAGNSHHTGYSYIKFNGKLYGAHRLAWLYMTGLMPIDILDHINGVRNDNRFCNLRAATKLTNSHNAKVRKHSTSGFKGISPHGSRWRARITVNGKRLSLGVHDTMQAAHRAYCLAAQKYFGEFASKGHEHD